MSDRCLDNAVDLDKCMKTNMDIILYGIGEYGKTLTDYLLEAGNKEKLKAIIVTKKTANEHEYNGIKIWDAETYLGMEDGLVLIAVSGKYQKDIEKIVRRFNKKYCCVTDRLYQEIVKRLKVPYQGIDFVVAGFPKCGTTSLYNAIHGKREIYLSKIKESQYFEWCDKVENPEKVLAMKYFNDIRKNQIVGMVEPSFVDRPERVYKFLGNQIKLIFLVRNPADAVFSWFKMQCRLGFGNLEEFYMKAGGSYSEEMFDGFFEQCKDTAVHVLDYIYWIEQFEKYYTKEQIKIYLFEDLVNNPKKIINDIFAFIGCSETYDEEEFPQENEGKYIMSDITGYQLAKERAALNENTKYYLGQEDVEKTHRLKEIYEKLDQADKIYGIKMTEIQRKKTEAFYNSSVRKLEKAINRDLSQIWF